MQHDGQIAHTPDKRDPEIFGVDRVADHVGNQKEGEAGDDHRHGRQPVEPVGEVHRIAERDDDEGAERYV
jgi:hypothetical protein